jgi:hypothetical protein
MIPRDPLDERQPDPSTVVQHEGLPLDGHDGDRATEVFDVPERDRRAGQEHVATREHQEGDQQDAPQPTPSSYRDGLRHRIPGKVGGDDHGPESPMRFDSQSILTELGTPLSRFVPADNHPGPFGVTSHFVWHAHQAPSDYRLIVPAQPDAHGTNQASSWMASMHSSTERASKMPTHSLPV